MEADWTSYSAVTQPRGLAGELLQAPKLLFSLFALNASTAPSPRDCCPVTGVLQGPPRWAQKDHTHPADERGDDWEKSVGPENPAVLTVPFSKRRAALQRQYDVRYRDWCRRVPTCTAAQLGLYVPARPPEQRLRCVQGRIGHLPPGHEQLQAQRSGSELQLSQQLLPSEEWGRSHFAWHFDSFPHACFVETYIHCCCWFFIFFCCISFIPPRVSMNTIPSYFTRGYFCSPYSKPHLHAFIGSHCGEWLAYEYVFCTLVYCLSVFRLFSGVSVQLVEEWQVEEKNKMKLLNLSQGSKSVRGSPWLASARSGM